VNIGAKDLLILSQAFIRTSENPVEGTGQTRTKFWDEVAVVYSQLKKQQEAYDSRQRKRAKYNSVLLRGEFLSSDDDGDDEDIQVIIPLQTASSLQQKWSKFVQPLVMKFITLTHRHPIKSGEGKLPYSAVSLLFILLFTIFFFFFTDKDRYYNRIHLIFLDENPNVSSFDIYRPSWEYLKDCAKFASITKALQTNPAVRSKKKQGNPKLPSSYSALKELVEAMMREMRYCLVLSGTRLQRERWKKKK
jgi:hypothetical protein